MTFPSSVLIAEDDLLISLIIERMLNKMGVEKVITVQTEDDTVEKTFSEDPDLVLLDVHLLEGNGLNAFYRIRKTSSVPIIVMTGSYPEIEEHPEISNYLIKPFESNALEESLRFAFREQSATG